MQSILMQNKRNVHGETLIQAIAAIFYLFQSKIKQQTQQIDGMNANIVTTCRATLNRTIDMLFKNARESITISEEQMKLIQKRHAQFTHNPTLQVDKRYDENNHFNQEEFYQGLTSFKEEKQQIDLSEKEQHKVIQNYASKILTGLVDDVVLYNAKVEQLRAKHDKSVSVEQYVPLRSVPLFHETDDPKYKNYVEVKIPNEKTLLSGKFGWCITCRNAAPFFCKDTRVPICSVDCKKKHFEELENVKLISNLILKHHFVDPSFDDAKLVFKYLCNITTKDLKQKNIQISLIRRRYIEAYVNKKKILALELIHHQLVQSEVLFATQTQYQSILMQDLMGVILKNSLLHEKANYMLSYGIFITIIFYYRDLLRDQIETLMDHTFFKGLETQQEQQKTFAVKVFEIILQNTGITLELFINHDCSIGNNSIVQLTVELLSKIGQQQNENGKINFNINPPQMLLSNLKL